MYFITHKKGRKVKSKTRQYVLFSSYLPSNKGMHAKQGKLIDIFGFILNQEMHEILSDAACIKFLIWFL